MVVQKSGGPLGAGMQKREGACETDIYITAHCGAANTALSVLFSLKSKGSQTGMDTGQAYLEWRIRRGPAVALHQPRSGMLRKAVAHVKTEAADWGTAPRTQAESP